MRRLLTLALCLLASPVLAQPGNWGSTKAQQEFRNALTAATRFGVPRYTTVALPTCDTANTGAVAFNTTSGSLTTCNGTAWVAGGGAAASVPFSGVTAGTNTAALEMTGQVSISGPDATTNVEIGSVSNDANAGTGGTSVAIGNNATNSGNGASNIVIAAGTSGTISASGAGNSGNIYIGQQGSVSGASVGNAIAIGTLAAGSASNSVSIGQSAAASASGAIAIGPVSASNGANAVVIGNTASAGAGANAIVIGQSTTGAANSITLGSGGTIAGAAKSFVAAGANAASIDNVYFGRGVAAATAIAYTINGTGGTGSNVGGAAVKLAGGKGTGTAAGGDVVLQRSPSIGTGSTPQSLTDAVYVRSRFTTLADGVATTVARISIPQGVAGLTGWTGGTIHYTVIANDATNYQARAGSVPFAFVNEAGTESCNNIGTATEADGTPTGTLTVAVTGASNAADTCDLLLNAASSLTETTLGAFWTIILNGPGTIAPQ